MKSKLMVGVGLLLLCVAIPAFAWDNQYGNDNSNSDYDNSNSGYDNSNSGYESSFGSRYEYDLSNPSDSIRYEVDPSAQLRDSIDVNPTRELERDLGQYGGGVYRD